MLKTILNLLNNSIILKFLNILKSLKHLNILNNLNVLSILSKCVPHLAISCLAMISI